MNKDTYYDIEFEFEEAILKSGFIEDMFYLKDLKQRKLFIATDICQETVSDAIRHIMQINREDMGEIKRTHCHSPQFSIILVFMTLFSHDIVIFKISLSKFYSRSLALTDVLEYIKNLKKYSTVFLFT